MSNTITIGCWHTPDYSHWADALEESMPAEIPFYRLRVNRSGKDWASETCRKPEMAADLLHRCETPYLLLVDADCKVLGSANAIVRACPANIDVAFFARGRWTKTGRPQLNPRTGTLLIRRSPAATCFLEKWAHAAENAPPHANDQDCLMRALSLGHGATVGFLPNSLCAVPADNCPDPLILHDRASKDQSTVSKWRRGYDALRHHLRQR